MTTRIPASMRTRQSLSDLIEGRLSTPAGRSELMKLATRLIVEEALEGESRDAVGRDYYEHGAEPGQGYRNGVRSGRLKTAEGFVEYSAPQVAGRDEPFRSEIREHLKGRTEALEDLAVELLARGLSVRDIEDAFRDETGRLLLSKTAVSEIGERLWADYQEFATRDIGEYEIAYLFVDGIAERIRPGQKREPVLAAWGFTASGAKVLLHLMAGSKEDAETVSAFFQDMRGRGLGDPLLVVCDGAAGIIKAIETCFPRSERQRCLAHRMRNLAAKVPEDRWPEFKARATAAYQAPSRAIARDLAAGLVKDYEAELPTAVACFMDDFEAAIAHLRMPITHRRAIRTTNLLERLFVEERRRLKIIPNAFGEKPVLKLMFGAMIRAAERWRAIRITDFERRQMTAVRQELDQEYEARNSLDKKAAAKEPRQNLSSSSRT
ncbi:IS256 family transposase [Mesorhizobium sp. M0500]|uniref:IS256 family transposase n=1 Tax=Mesorhizobium sp. M0500 TaxID=2956953 RepID=UPI003334D767